MAAIIDGFKKFANYVVEGIGGESPFDIINDPDDEYGDDYGYETYEDGNAVRETAPSYSNHEYERPENKVIKHPAATRGENNVVVIEPRSFDDAAAVVQHLKDRKIVMLNLHLLDKIQSQRTIDYVCGASQALNGNQKKVGDLVFVFAPSNVTLSADEVQEQQNKFNDSMWRTSLQ